MNNEKVTKSEEKKWLKVKKWPKKVTKSEQKKWRNFDKKMTKISVPAFRVEIFEDPYFHAKFLWPTINQLLKITMPPPE